LSKLPGDVKKRKLAASEEVHTLDCDLREKPAGRVVAPYSDKTLNRIAIEWIDAADLVSNSTL
jgi:hypothetical protein